MKKTSGLINALDNRFDIKFMQLGIGLFFTEDFIIDHDVNLNVKII